MTDQRSVIIIGAGLSGLYAAWRLHRHYDVTLLEARSRIGGRIISPQIGEQAESKIDLGPAWCWPQLQPRLHQLTHSLNIKTFSQFTQGDILYEESANKLQRYTGTSSHNQSYRIVGGCISLIEKLSADLNLSTIQTNTKAININQNSLSIKALHDDKNITYTADKIIIALPLRILEQQINFEPSISSHTTQIWKDTPTWMSGHCKIIFIYENAFWRNDNLSGEVFSRAGPMSEIYDGSPENNEYYALTAFIGLTAQQRTKITQEQLIQLCKQQLERLFGAASQRIKDVHIKDWSTDNFTASETDLSTIAQHPQYPETATRSFSNNRIILAGTETAIEHGGYLEGALESAELAISILKRTS